MLQKIMTLQALVESLQQQKKTKINVKSKDLAT
jgi:hypothetical protein